MDSANTEATLLSRNSQQTTGGKFHFSICNYFWNSITQMNNVTFLFVNQVKTIRRWQMEHSLLGDQITKVTTKGQAVPLQRLICCAGRFKLLAAWIIWHRAKCSTGIWRPEISYFVMTMWWKFATLDWHGQCTKRIIIAKKERYDMIDHILYSIDLVHLILIQF